MEKTIDTTQKTWTDSIEAGQTVSSFLTQINDNFDILNHTKQNKIYIMSAQSGTASSDITIDEQGKLTGGKPGDIVILYE